MNKLNSVTRELASVEGIVLIDTALEKSLSREENFSDLCHFTETGAKNFAHFLAKIIKEDIVL